MSEKVKNPTSWLQDVDGRIQDLMQQFVKIMYTVNLTVYER